jgi:hypothetical protein
MPAAEARDDAFTIGISPWSHGLDNGFQQRRLFLGERSYLPIHCL